MQDRSSHATVICKPTNTRCSTPCVRSEVARSGFDSNMFPKQVSLVLIPMDTSLIPTIILGDQSLVLGIFSRLQYEFSHPLSSIDPLEIRSRRRYKHRRTDQEDITSSDPSGASSRRKHKTRGSEQRDTSDQPHHVAPQLSLFQTESPHPLY
jgi:hypothetical protein